MIYLITGTPGTGKTAFLMSAILDNKYGLFRDEDGNPRPLFSVNIPGVNTKVIPMTSVSADDFMAAPLTENFPAGSVVVVDEASEVYPARVMSAKLPAHVEGLNTLRHHGYSLIIITQNPQMIDPYVLNLVGMHIHLERKQVGSKIYEWTHVQKSFNAAAYATAVSHYYKPDKRVFGLYKSSSMHVKFKKSVAWYYKALLLLPFFIGGAYYFAYGKIQDLDPNKEANAAKKEQKASESATLAGLGTNSASTASSAGQPGLNQPAIPTPVDYEPRVNGRPETAPIYDTVRRVADMPQIVGCIEVKADKSCNCYTQQGTLADVSSQFCRTWASGERPFNPYKQQQQQAAAPEPVAPAAEQEKAKVYAMGGKSLPSLMYDGYVEAGDKFRPNQD